MLSNGLNYLGDRNIKEFEHVNCQGGKSARKKWRYWMHRVEIGGHILISAIMACLSRKPGQEKLRCKNDQKFGIGYESGWQANNLKVI